MRARANSSRRWVAMWRLAGVVGAGALLTGALLTDAAPLPVTYALAAKPTQTTALQLLIRCMTGAADL